MPRRPATSPRSWKMCARLFARRRSGRFSCKGVALGAQWLEENRVDACLIIGAEETNWILADALWHLDRSAILTSGAGALCLCRDPKCRPASNWRPSPIAHTYSAPQPAAGRAAMRGQLGGVLPENCFATGSETVRARTRRNARRGAIGPARGSVRSESSAKD
jgi:hypothetical protein